MHPKVPALVSGLPDPFDVDIDPDTDVVTFSWHGQYLGAYDPNLDYATFQIALRVEVDDEGNSHLPVDLNEVVVSVQKFCTDGFRVADYRIEWADDDPAVTDHVLTLEGEGIDLSAIRGALAFAWGWSLPAIRTSSAQRVRLD